MNNMGANALTRLVMDALEFHGYKVWRQNSGYVRKNVKLAPNGTSDIVGCGPRGRFVAFEIKVGTDKLRESQITWMSTINSIGGFVRVLTSIEDLEEALVEYDTGSVVPW